MIYMDCTAELFCILDGFCKILNASLEKLLIANQNQPTPKSALSLSEVMTIVILFHESYYSREATDPLNIFIALCWCLSGNRLFPSFLAITALQTLSSFFRQVKGNDTDISVIDSTKLVVCYNLRIKRHRVFKGLENRGKSSTGWLYGFKLHVVINNLGEIINFKVTSANIHDVSVIEALTFRFKGGYYSEIKAT